MIQASLYGRLGRDPKAATTKTGKPMTSASLAVDVGRDPGEETLWVSLLAFGVQADILERAQKGDMVAVMGRLTRGRYTAADGTERESWSLLVDAMHSSRTIRPGNRRPESENVPRTGGESRGYPEYSAPDGAAGEAVPFDDDIPF